MFKATSAVDQLYTNKEHYIKTAAEYLKTDILNYAAELTETS